MFGNYPAYRLISVTGPRYGSPGDDRAATRQRPGRRGSTRGVLTEFTGLRRNKMWQSREVIAGLDEFPARVGRRR